MADVVVPIVHLNGSSKESLLGDLERTVLALEDTIELLRQGAPNQRDYYPVDGLYELALAQYRARLAALESVLESLNEERSELYFGGED